MNISYAFNPVKRTLYSHEGNKGVAEIDLSIESGVLNKSNWR